MSSSVSSVSRVVESIWDTREVDVSDAEGSQKQKQYFVKYKGLAHIHNQWVPETQLLHEAHLLVENFNKNEVMQWNEAWTKPHQVLRKRLLLSFKPLNENQENEGKVLNYHYEWLVRWQSLDYEQATWEPENASVLDSPEGQNLMKEYENHHGKATTLASPVDKTKELPVKLPTIPACCPPGMDNIHLSYVKNLHGCWNKGQNSVVFDDQERAMRIVLFILSLKGVTQPFLLITTSNSLSQWEAMFLQVAPCNDFKVYIENTEAQRSSRLLEVQKEGGHLVFQVLLYPVDAFVKDLNVLKTIKWEGVIIDESQQSEISTHFDHIKNLSSDKRLLIFCGPLGGSMTGCLDLLTLLGFDGALPSCITSKTESGDSLGKLKEALSQFIAYECKPDSSKFVEFWVPVQISNVQLEKYCSTLLDNAMALRSWSKSDASGALHDILISNRKCCDHPYIVEQSLQERITKGLEPTKLLDVGIKASGKLQFLDLMLLEMKKRQLRVLILFQPISGSGRDSASIGDILDDFVRQRFGEDSYERVDGVGIVPSKKQAALNNFNNKDMGRFIFLLEYRACFPSIKLSSIDTIVIFDSDWNPANDLRALQKITIDSQSEQIMIFRLYTKWTLEEKILRLAEHNMTIDSKLQNLSRSTSDALLMWGALYLFNKLAEFHSASAQNISSGDSFLNKLREEFLNLISGKCKSKDTDMSIITRVQQNCGTYGKNLPSPGELIMELPDGEEPHIFWRKLLEGKNPRWKYLSGSTQRQRKRPQYFEESSRKTSAGKDDAGKKRKKTANNITEPAAALKPVIEESETGGSYEGASGVPVHEPHLAAGDSVRSAAVRNETSLHHFLRHNVYKLCNVLKISEDVKLTVERFLEYVIKNYRVNKEPANTLQAFLISLCWISCSLLKHKLDRSESIALAKKHLNFSCKEEEVNSVCTKLELAKEMFLHCTENQKKTDASRHSVPAAQATSKQSLDKRVSHSGPLELKGVKVKNIESLRNHFVDDERILLEHGLTESCKLSNDETLQCTKQMPSKCEKRMEDLEEKNKKEIEKFNSQWDERRVHLENEHKVDKAFIRTLHSNPSTRSVKLKLLEKEFAKKLEEHERQRGIYLNDLKAAHLATERQMAENSNFSTCEDKAPTPVLSAVIVTSPNGMEGGSIHTKTVQLHTEPNSASNKVTTVPLPLVGASIEDQLNRGDNSNIGIDNVVEDGRNKEQPTRVGSSYDRASNIEPTSSHTFEEQADATVSSMAAEEIEAQKHIDIPNEVAKHVDFVEMEVLATEGGNISPDASHAGEDQNETQSNDVEGQVEMGMPTLECNKENTEDGTISPYASHAGKDQNQTHCNDVEGHADSVGTGVPTVVCNEENAEGGTVSPNATHPVEDQNDPHCSSSSNSSSAAAPQEKEPAVQPFVSPALDHSVPTNLEIQNEPIQLQQLLCNGVQGKEVQANPSSLEAVEVNNIQPIDAGQVDGLNPEDSSLAPHEELCSPLSINPTVAENQSNISPASVLVLENTCDLGAPSRSTGSHANPSDHNMMQSSENSEEHPLAAETPLGEHQPDLHSADRVGRQSSGELHNSFLNPEALPIIAEIPNEAAMLSILSTFQGSDNHNQGALRMPNHSLSTDPLQAELHKLCEVKESIIKSNEDIKLKLKAEYEKEIAEITIKYEAKRLEAEATFQFNKKELDINLNRVLMNKILADAFRSKCQDPSSSGPVGMQQVTQSGSGQHLHQASMPPSPRPSPGVASSSPGQLSGTQQVRKRSPPLQVVHQPAALFSSTPSRPSSDINPSNMPSRAPPKASPISSSSTPSRPPSNLNPSGLPSRSPPNINAITPSSTPSRPPIIPSNTPSGPPPSNNPSSLPNKPQPNVSSIATSSKQNGSAPSVKPITPSSMSSRPPPNINPITPSSTPSRPLLNINPITPSARNPRVSSEIRAPAPHIRPFRPSGSASPPNLVSHQRALPCQQVSSGLPLNSPTLPQASPRPPLPPSSLQPPAPLLTDKDGLPTQNSLSSLPAASPLSAQASSQPPLQLPSPSPPPPPASPQLPAPSQLSQQSPPQASSQPPAAPSMSAHHSLLPSEQRPASSLPQILLPPITTSHTGLYNAAPRPEIGVQLATSGNLRLSALDLLMDINERVVGHEPNILAPPPDLSLKFELLDLAEFGREAGAPGNSSMPQDLVCLSDDD